MASLSDGQAIDRATEGGLGFGEERNGWHPDWSQKPAASSAPSVHSGPGALLLKVIEGEIIPRLLLAHCGPLDSPAQTAAASRAKLAAIGDIETFARLVLTSQAGDIVDRVQILLDGGIKLERVYVELLAPVARLLGIYWQEDRCSFAEVTLGLSRLHQVVHETGQRCRNGTKVVEKIRRAYFAPSPGEQHTFGLTMLEELFQFAGWQTSSDHGASAAAIVRKLTAEVTDVVGFSVGCEKFLLPLTDLITATRKASRNREIVVMVGGSYITDHPGVAANIGADTVLCDGEDAVDLAEKLVSDASRGSGKRTLM